MKFGNVEGTPEEVKDFFENNGLNTSDFFEPPDVQLKKIWIVIPSTIFLTCVLLLIAFDPSYEKTKVACFSIGFSAILWLAVSVHIRFKSGWGAGSIIFCGLLILLVALGVMEPAQLTKYLENLEKA